MNLTTSILFYLLFGGAVAVAVHLVSDASSTRDQWFRTATAIFFWPLYVPALLQRPHERTGKDLAPQAATERLAPEGRETDEVGTMPQADAISRVIAQVESELDLALSSLDGWSDAVLAREQYRFDELRRAWRAQADKIHELDALLAQPAFTQSSTDPTADELHERAASSERARHANVARLQAVRRQLHDDLLNTLTWVRELVTMIHLAKYTGAPASRAQELVMQIATSIEGLSEVAAWRETEEAGARD